MQSSLWLELSVSPQKINEADYSELQEMDFETMILDKSAIRGIGFFQKAGLTDTGTTNTENSPSYFRNYIQGIINKWCEDR